MTAATLWIEITIAGSVYLFALLFLVLRIAGISDLDFLTRENAPLAYVAVVAVGTSYVLGIVAHRLIQIGGIPLLRLAERLFPIDDPGSDDSKDAQYHQLVPIWQHGSERLHREFDFQFALQALLRSLVFSIPFLGFSAGVWLWSTEWSKHIWWVVVAAVVFEICVYMAYRRQREQFFTFKESAFQETDRIRKGLPVAHDT
jgi:hypothetical protein